MVNQPYISLSTALSTYTGQNYGAGKRDRIIGVWGIWWSAGLVWMVSAIACLMRYHRRCR